MGERGARRQRDRRRGLQLCAMLFCVGLLSACAGLAPEAERSDAGATDGQVAHFTLQGKLGWQHPEDRGRASLDWQQRRDAYRLLLSGPLGQGAVRIDGDDQGVVVETGNRRWQAPSAQTLLADVLGFAVPVRAARWWVLGRAVPGIAVDERLDSGIKQLGWRVQWADWRRVDGRAVPRRVQLERDALRLTLVIGDWSFAGE